MIYVIIGLGLVFLATGFIVTEKNAKYLLSGYNTMSVEERKKVDLKSFLPYFRNFHIFLGISFTIVGLLLMYIVSENAAGIFLVIYPVLAYIYFLRSSSVYAKGLGSKWNKAAIFISIGVLIFVIGIMALHLKEDRLTIHPDQIEIQGIYGEQLSPSDIQRVKLIDQLPDIKWKTNGFALGSVRKGYFRTEGGETVKLIINAPASPYLLLTTTDNKKIYYSSSEEPNEKVLERMKEALPGLPYD